MIDVSKDNELCFFFLCSYYKKTWVTHFYRTVSVMRSLKIYLILAKETFIWYTNNAAKGFVICLFRKLSYLLVPLFH